MAHKGALGHVLIVGGSLGKAGAVLLAARAALRAGAGLVTMAVPASLARTVDTALTEGMTLALVDTVAGQIGEGAWRDIGERIAEFDAAVVGPGMGTGRGAAELLRFLLEHFEIPIVADADAINLLARNRNKLSGWCEAREQRGDGPLVFTPHPGEMSRLIGTDSATVQRDRLGVARAFCRSCHGVLVLKGAGTLVCDSTHVAFNTSGNSGMASPGMGDVLAGTTGAVLASGTSPFNAAALATFVHGLSGDILAGRLGGPGFLASEVADTLPRAFAALL